jgi:hypothetical protein
MIDQVLQKLIEFLQNASPLVWSTLVKQVYVEAISMIAWAVGLFVLCLLLIKFGKWLGAKSEEMAEKRSDYDTDGYNMGKWVSYLSSFMAGVFFFSLLIEAFKHIANPNFYAIQYIVQTITGK